MDEQYIIDLKVKTPGVASATKKIKELEAEMAKLEKTSESYKQKQIDIGRIQNASGESTKKLGSTVNNAKESIGGLNKGLSGSSVLISGFTAGIALAGAALLEASKRIIAIEKEFTKLQKTVSRTSGLIGTDLDNATASISALATTFGKDTDEINKAANAFAKQTGISYIEALTLIEKGLLQGADANGDFLDKLREYPIQFKEAGFSAEEFVKIATQEVRGGIFGDKLLDSVKELGLSIRELDKAQTDALTGAFGSAFTTDFVSRVNSGKLSVKDALGVIITESNKAGLSVQATQKLTADLFKGAGEDAGGFKEIIKQLTEAQQIQLDSLDSLAQSQKDTLELQKELSIESVRLSDNLTGLSTGLSNFATKLQTGALKAINSFIERLFVLDTFLNKQNKTIEDYSKKGLTELTIESEKAGDNVNVLTQELSLLNAETAKTGEGNRDLDSVERLNKKLKETVGLETDRIVTAAELGQIIATESKKQLAIQEELDKRQAAGLKDSETGFSALDKKITTTTKTITKGREAVIDYTKEFNKLKKSFKDNFESQRLEAQKQFLSGLISEEELASRIFAINQQENAVLITITANKKEIAKTGEESLEISKLEVDTLQQQSDELVRQLGIRNKIIESEKNLRSAELDIRGSELKIEEEAKVQEVITDVSIKSEEDRQKAIAKVRADFAVRERQLRIEALKQNVKDTQAELSNLNQGSTDTDTEEGRVNSENIANATKELIGYKAELAGLETQQLEAANSLDITTNTTLDKLAKKAEKINGYIQQVAEGFKQAVEADIALTDSKLSAQEARIEAGVELAKLGNDELLNQELERQEKLLQEREKQANREKAIAAIQVAANLGVAVAKAAAEGGVLAPATIALVLGAVGIGFASIGGLIGGAFADGVIDFKGKGTERSDSNIVAISRGESVITAKGTKNASKMLTMINEGKLKDSDYLTAGLDLAPIQAVNQAIDIRNELNQQIALSSELLDEMRNFYTKIEFDARGVHQTVNTKNKRITKINSR